MKCAGYIDYIDSGHRTRYLVLEVFKISGVTSLAMVISGHLLSIHHMVPTPEF